MAKARVTTIDEAVLAYGGERKFFKAFRLKGTVCFPMPREELESWRAHGVPRGHQLGLFRGLQERGYEPTPKLFHVKSWADIPGVAL